LDGNNGLGKTLEGGGLAPNSDVVERLTRSILREVAPCVQEAIMEGQSFDSPRPNTGSQSRPGFIGREQSHPIDHLAPYACKVTPYTQPIRRRKKNFYAARGGRTRHSLISRSIQGRQPRRNHPPYCLKLAPDIKLIIPHGQGIHGVVWPLTHRIRRENPLSRLIPDGEVGLVRLVVISGLEEPPR
jgi:hypothetical protein